MQSKSQPSLEGRGKPHSQSQGAGQTSSSPQRRAGGGSSSKRRLTYMERRELEQLGPEIEAFEQEKRSIIEALSGGTISVEEITEKSKRLPLLQAELDEKEMR